jgi:hypothetical protein
MRKSGWTFFALAYAVAAIANAQAPLPRLPCGPKPIPDPGCFIASCGADGLWKQNCAEDEEIRCGIKPIPDFGCYVGECKGGRWEQICDPNAQIPCGAKPVPPVGCKVGACVAGQWDVVCSDTVPLTPLD